MSNLWDGVLNSVTWGVVSSLVGVACLIPIGCPHPPGKCPLTTSAGGPGPPETPSPQNTRRSTERPQRSEISKRKTSFRR